MKKLMAIAVAVVLVLTLGSGVVFAGKEGSQPEGELAVFEATIVPTPWSDQSLTKGEVYVRADGSVKIEIEGALINTPYDVYLGRLVLTDPPSWTWEWILLGTFTTDDDGEGDLDTTISETWAAPVLRITLAGVGHTKFTSGF